MMCNHSLRVLLQTPGYASTSGLCWDAFPQRWKQKHEIFQKTKAWQEIQKGLKKKLLRLCQYLKCHWRGVITVEMLNYLSCEPFYSITFPFHSTLHNKWQSNWVQNLCSLLEKICPPSWQIASPAGSANSCIYLARKHGVSLKNKKSEKLKLDISTHFIRLPYVAHIFSLVTFLRRKFHVLVTVIYSSVILWWTSRFACVTSAFNTRHEGCPQLSFENFYFVRFLSLPFFL